MKNVKQRKVFSLNNFRGLDTENKALQVESFRASDGKNFILESDILKTRPSLTFLKSPLSKSLEGNNINEYYIYKDFEIYFSGINIFVKYKDVLLNYNTTPKLHYNITNQGTRYNLIFQEEKDVLFVFGSNDVLVLAPLYNGNSNEAEHFFIYSLNKKGPNPFHFTDSYYQPYEELPTPYEPTLFIGSNPLDDINLLSNVSKYKVFANDIGSGNGGINTFRLPTHFDVEKHGVNTHFEVEFYKNKYIANDIFPVFMGKEEEDFAFTNDPNMLESQPILIEEGYKARETFEYRIHIDEQTSEEIIEPIKEILNITQKEFFNLKIDGSAKNVFEYILDYIDTKQTTDFLDNSFLSFNLPYEKTAEYKDEDNITKKVYKEKSNEIIYVKIIKITTGARDFINEEFLYNSIRTKTDQSFPDYPTYTIPEDETFLLSPENSYIEKNSHDILDFKELVSKWKNHNKNNLTLTGNSLIRLNALFLSSEEINITQQVTITNNFESEMVIYDDSETGFPDYPTYDFILDVLDAGDFSGSGQNTKATFFYPEVINFIKNNLDRLSEDEGEAICKFRWKSFFELHPGDFRENRQSVILLFNYRKGKIETVKTKTSYSVIFKVKEVNTYKKNDIYNIKYDNELKSFLLEIKDYFYDYNNEPAIDVKITFERNPDFEIIANSEFGINFGNENRLFLSGNREYPNIDRYNVSNDLLGDNIKKQSYELSYFPSKNYRVVGGPGAINGYILATDSQLYITKEKYLNDNTLYIRQRNIDDVGIVRYHEIRTNINKTPLNKDCVARFYNDILILDESGLYGVEISSNVLTDERLVKNRSSFINKKLIKDIKENEYNSRFIYEDDENLFIVLGNKIYLADSRYFAKNENGEVGNFNYEIVYWELPETIDNIKKIDNDIVFLNSFSGSLYTLKEFGSDDLVRFEKDAVNISRKTSNGNYVSLFQWYDNENILLENPEKVSFKFPHDNYLKRIGRFGNDFVSIDAGTHNIVNIINETAFRDLVDGDNIYCVENNVLKSTFIVNDLEENNRESFTVNGSIDCDIYKEYKTENLYIKAIYFDEGYNKMILSPYKAEKIEKLESLDDYQSYDNEVYYFEDVLNLKDVLVFQKEPIELQWLSAITDFGNNLMEKTLFRGNFYLSKQDNENLLFFGYKTMRRLKSINEQTNLQRPLYVSEKINATDTFDFGELGFKKFGLNTFQEFGMSLPLKENNFLYIQFLIIGKGQLEINSIDFIFKNNRMLKSIG